MTNLCSLRITVIGTGYVGLVTGVCLAKEGHQVVCVDKNLDKINKLKEGIIPIYEPGLKKLVIEALKAKKLFFSNKINRKVLDAQVVFIAVGTPSSRRGDGYADLNYVFEAIKEIAPLLKKDTIVVNKSTVPVGTADYVKNLIQEINPKAQFFMASNPEFLREGVAVKDFLLPDRVIIGVKSKKAKHLLQKVYFFAEKKLFFTDIRSAELIKYASNAFLATKISFINEISNLCEKIGANIVDVSRGMGLDHRIGSDFLKPGPGYGGSCFPKDVVALLRIAQENESSLRILETVSEVNLAQKARMISKIQKVFQGKENKTTLLFLGLTFKPNTDDLREAPALTIIPTLIEKGFKIIAHDPRGMKEAKKILPPEVKFATHFLEEIKKVDGVVLMTEWDEYKKIDLALLKKKLQNRKFIDLRNVFDLKEVKKHNLNYLSLGRN